MSGASGRLGADNVAGTPVCGVVAAPRPWPLATASMPLRVGAAKREESQMAFSVHGIMGPCLLCVAVSHCEVAADSTATLVNPDR